MRRVTPEVRMVIEQPPAPERIPGPHGYRIPVRRYGAEGRRRPVILLHGLQSHSGWFVQSATRLAALGHPVLAFDRCGSGLSELECDGGPALTSLLVEIDAVATTALAANDHDSVHLLGHCFGALPALLYAALHRPERVATLMLATPALYTRTDVPLRDKLRILWGVLSGRPARVPVPLQPEEFSELDPFIRFVREDALSLREVPGRLLFEVVRARRRLPRAAESLHVPTLVCFAGDDPICDNARNRTLLERVSAPMEIHEYRGARHVLEFSGERQVFLDDLCTWLEKREVGA